MPISRAAAQQAIAEWVGLERNREHSMSTRVQLFTMVAMKPCTGTKPVVCGYLKVMVPKRLSTPKRM